MAKNDKPGAATTPLYQRPAFRTWAPLLLFAAFACLALPYLRGDLWFDELITLGDYTFGRPLSGVFTNYRAANNHMLFSALLWAWVRLIQSGSELVLRLPNLAMAMLAGWLLFVHGRRLWDGAAGLILAAVLLFSPVYLGFFWQLRGYGLSILLGTLATLGAIYLVRGERRRGWWLFAPAAVLLPMVLPSNLLLNLSLFAFVNLCWWRRRQWRQRLDQVALLALAAVVGMAIYLPVLGDFLTVMGRTRGWSSGWLAAGHWLLALAAHGGLVLAAVYAFRKKLDRGDGQTAPTGATGAPGPTFAELALLGGCCLAPLLLVLLLRAPFPRSLLAYLAPFTLCTLIWYRPGLLRRNAHLYVLVFLLLANSMVLGRVTAFLTEDALRSGRETPPQDLLCQFYAGSSDMAMTAAQLARGGQVSPFTRIWVPYHYYKSFQNYWRSVGGDPAQVECLYHGDPPQFPPAFADRTVYARLPQLLLAYNGERGRRLYEQATGLQARIEPRPAPTPLGIFRLLARPPGETLPPVEPPAKPPEEPGIEI